MSSEREALEAAIDANVDEPSAYAVLGDWYAQHGHPRGELIALQLGGAKASRQRKEREEALLFTRGIRIAQAQRAQWRWGFVHTLLFELVRHRGWEAHLGDWPEVLLRRELEHESCRFLRELVVDASPGDLALRYLSARPPRHLRALTLHCNELDLAQLGPGLAQLERLGVSAQLVLPAALPLPRLGELSLPLDALSGHGLALVLESVREPLRRLTLTSLEPFEAAALAPALGLPSLEALTLRGERLGRSAIDALAESLLSATLRRLDVLKSGITEEAAQRLLKLAPRFPRLEALVLGESAEP